LTLSVHVLELALLCIHLAFVLFFFAKARSVHHGWDRSLVLLATVVTAGPICVASVFRAIDVGAPQWILLANEAAFGLIVRLSIVCLCSALAVWSPWERRRAAGGLGN